MTYRDYSVFGLRVRSEIPLPELFEACGEEQPDVTVDVGPVPKQEGQDQSLVAMDDGALLVIPDVARFRISQGSRITVDPAAGAPERNVRLYLLGSAFGALLHQRGTLPLHANAIEIGGRAFAFMGESGAGKSTLAAWFHDRGHRILADDVCVAGFSPSGQPFAAPGLPRLRLWAEALAMTGRAAAGYSRSYVGTDEDKFDVPINPVSAAQSELPLTALYLLGRSDRFAVTPLLGVEAADAVFANTYRGAYISATSGQQDHWESAVRLVRAIPVYRFDRVWALDRMDEQNRLLSDHVAAQQDDHRAAAGRSR